MAKLNVYKILSCLKVSLPISWKKFGLLFFFNISCYASSLSPYTTKELDQLEKEFIQLINQSSSLERNPLATQYINHLGKQLAHAGHIKTPHFFIVKSREINAFAGPGGHIGVNTQLVLTSNNESELAAVMAHEIAHVRLHHLYSAIEHQKQMQMPMLASMLAAIALGAVNPTVGMGAMMASLSGFSQDSINYTRSKEKEADRIGIDMLIKAGFNPQGMADFFKKMQENSRYYYTANVPAILRTHPLDHDRIAEADSRTAHLKGQSYSSSLDYYLFKELVRVGVVEDHSRLIAYYDQQCTMNTLPKACDYGKVLNYLNMNQFAKAQSIIQPLLTQDPNNLHFQIATAQAEIGLHQHQSVLIRLSELQKNHPDNYAILMAHAQALLATNQTAKASNVLLKGSRQYPHDLPLCRELARAQASANQKTYAYFTQAQCLLLEGQKRGAVAQLKVARDLAKKDPYMTDRINAKIDEIMAMLKD